MATRDIAQEIINAKKAGASQATIDSLNAERVAKINADPQQYSRYADTYSSTTGATSGGISATPKPVSSVTPATTPQTANDGGIMLREALLGGGYKVGYDNGTVTVNGKPIDTTGMTLQDGHYYGSLNQIQNALERAGVSGDSNNNGDGNGTPKTDDLKSLYEQIMGMIPTSTPQPVLSWDEAMTRSQNQLNPIYDRSLKKVADVSDYNNIQSGFYGQMPGDAVKRENLMNEEAQRAQGISALASELVGKSEQSARDKESLVLQRENTRLGTITSLMGMQNQKEQNSVQNALQAQTIANSQTNADRDYALQVKNMSLSEAKFNLDALVQEGQLSIAQKDQILREKQQTFEQQMEGAKFNFQKFLDSSKLSLEQSQQAIDAAIKKGQLSIQQGNLLLEQKKYDWDTNADNPDNILKMANAKKASTEKTTAQQDTIDNTAFAEATAQNADGTIKDWWGKHKIDLAKDLSTQMYTKIYNIVNPPSTTW